MLGAGSLYEWAGKGVSPAGDTCLASLYGISALSIMLMVLYMRHERRSLIQAVKAQVARKQRIAEAKKIQEQ